MLDPSPAIQSAFAKIRPEIEALFAEQWARPELPGMEYRSAAALTAFLARHGFAVETGIGGVPTAFVARRGKGSPRVAILAEYDALAGLDNDPVPYRTGSGRAPGHGCGHNHIGPANSGAGIVAALAAAELGLPGEISVYGCPAEEILWGKVALLAAGVFDGVNAVLTSHGDYQNGAIVRPCQSISSGEFVFRGESAHGGKGLARNALGTAEQALAAFEHERAARFPEAQLRHVFRMGGVMPGVTPDEVRIWCTIRHASYETALAAYRAMAGIFVRTARETGVDCTEKFVSACRGYLPNESLGRLLADCLGRIGPPRWSEADIVWMRNLSAAASPGETFELHRELAYFDSGIDYYAQDDGDLSWVVPLGRVNWAYPATVPIHHWAWTALSGHPASSPGPLMATQALALAAVELLQRPTLLKIAADELHGRTGGAVHAPVTPGINAIMAEDPRAFWDARW